MNVASVLLIDTTSEQQWFFFDTLRDEDNCHVGSEVFVTDTTGAVWAGVIVDVDNDNDDFLVRWTGPVTEG